jgi:hypothetical protein
MVTSVWLLMIGRVTLGDQFRPKKAALPANLGITSIANVRGGVFFEVTGGYFFFEVTSDNRCGLRVLWGS